MSNTAGQTEEEEIEADEAESLPLTRFLGKIVIGAWKLWRGWRPPQTDDKEDS